jgi:hypothetical protein
MRGLMSFPVRVAIRSRGALLLLLLVTVVGAAPLAQTPQAPAAPKPSAPKPAAPATESATSTRDLPSARSILDRHIKEMGGRAAILAHSSTHATGTISMTSNGITGAVDVYAAKPDKSLVKISLGGIGDIVEGFDGTYGWTLQPLTGPMLSEGKELAQKKFDADFYSDLHQEGRYASMKTVEKTSFDGRPCYKVALTRKEGGEDIEYYDVQTGLKAGAVLTRESPMGPITATQVHSDYKKFGDLLLATTMKQTQMGVEQILKITSFEFDNVPPSTFDPPAQIKALIK